MNPKHSFMFYYVTIVSLLLLHYYVAMASILDITTDQSSLIAFKNHISQDPNNVLTKNWSHNTHVCNWVGITCGSSHHRVVSLNLSNMGLIGTIPPNLANLSFLNHLILPNNSFQGNLPYELASLHRLRTIDLRFNNLRGNIIASMFVSMTKLTTLSLAWNSFTGTTPCSLFNMTSLRILDLRGNSLWGSLPSNMFLSPSLEYVTFYGNKISGTLPSSVSNNSQQLRVVDLRNNRMFGELPRNILRHLPYLEVLSLSRNGFFGEIPDSLFSCKELWHLDLSNNNFSGNIPPGIGNLTHLKYIYLQSNNFGGNLPRSLGSMLPKLERLVMGKNYLSGRIPSSLCNATNLIRIDLAFNSFSGQIPDIFGNLRSLEWLNLDENNSTTNPSNPELMIINSLTNCRYLKFLSLVNNPLNSLLPISIGNLSTSLSQLRLTGCSMRGSIPTSIANLSSLLSLSLGQNQFVGSLPNGIGKLQKLQGLMLSDNKLEGFVPHGLCQLKSLDSLALDSNSIYGPIPSCLSNLSSLRQFWISSNVLNSTIPSTLWSLSNLLLLDLSSNNLSGTLPFDMSNLNALTWLYLSRNQLSGSIPSSLGNLVHLGDLSLAQNEFEGVIPESFGRLVSLERLDLSKNNLSGVIPKSLESLLYLNYFNVSYNKLEGEIPHGGPFANFSVQSFIMNRGLCGASRLQFPECETTGRSRKTTAYIFLKYILPISSVATILVLAFLSILKFQNHNKVLQNFEVDQAMARWRRISYYEIQQATDRFNGDNLLGIGSFGKVYKGVLSDGTNVAIKVFNLGLEGAFRSFDLECEVLRNIRHRNLTKIISSCSNLDFKALVMSYMVNGSLEKWLHSEDHSLSMIERINIVIDIAEAINYLHHGGSISIVHCDLKPSNILVDEDMVAHVTDFGIAKLLNGGNSMTHTLTLATMGYVAPEYGLEGLVSKQGDVYSYGILLMEIFTQKKPTDEMFMGDFSIKHWVEMSYLDSLIDIVDARLLMEEGELASKKECLSSIMKLALDCTKELPRERTTMKDVITTLKKIKMVFL